MRLFLAIKHAAFAVKLFGAAGLNFETLFAANDENALKAHIAKAVAEAPAKPDADAEQALADAVAENTDLTAKLANAVKLNSAAAAKLAAVGISAETPEAAKAAYEAAVAKSVRVELAKAGHPGVNEIITDEPAKPGAKGKTLTRAQFNALPPGEQGPFATKHGNKITD